jgi:hypothetical protein
MATQIKTKTRIFNISSRDSLNGSYKSQVPVSLPDLNFSNSNIQNVYLSVLHCEVPNSFYIVNYTNNSIVINNITYTLTRGNYSANSFITMLLALLPAGYVMLYNNTTNKYTMSYSSNFTINCSNPNCKINTVMGLGTTDITSSSFTLEFPYSVNFLPLPRLNFRSDAFKLTNFNQSDNSSNVFMSLQNNAPQMGCINYQSSNSIKFSIEDKYITAFTISATDDFGNLINFNNVDWFITFQFDIEYVELVKLLDFNTLISQQQFQY